MCGALAPIGDVYKTRVYELARFINKNLKNPQTGISAIPERVLTKAPSAELRPNQTDQDSLPPYDQLDGMLLEYLEKRVPVSDVIAKFGAASSEIIRKVEINEFKRRQGAPVLKVSPKAFGLGRRYPIAKTWKI